jgi:malate synthase
VHISAKDLLAVPSGDITEEGLRVNIDVGIQYLEAWLMGNGCVPIYNLMEDAATAEISRSQVWQWVRHGAKLNDGRPVNAELIRKVIPEQLEHIRKLIGPQRFDSGKFDLASKLFEDMMTRKDFSEFLTLVAYDYID